MRYCPYCSAAVSEKSNTCHNCKKSLDLEQVREVYRASEAGESAEINKQAVRRLWLQEHMRFIMPAITLLAGLAIGALIAFVAMKASFAAEKSALTQNITSLRDSLAQQRQMSMAARGDLASDLETKDKIISLLSDQRETMARVINFTRRLANNSQIIPASDSESQYYRNNVRYLIRQYQQQQDELIAAGADSPPNYNLETVPQMLE